MGQPPKPSSSAGNFAKKNESLTWAKSTAFDPESRGQLFTVLIA
jgi:hypothetical protein